MSYQRVFPRDLFNEAKLLKCLGQVSLLILDDEGVKWPYLTIEHDEDQNAGFEIGQHWHSGDIFCRNVNVLLAGKRIPMHTALNSKAPYPLCFEDDDGGEESVFDDDGTFSGEFTDFLDRTGHRQGRHQTGDNHE